MNSTIENYKSFPDSNIWLYALTDQDDERKVKAEDLIERVKEKICVSTQVINEVCLNLKRKSLILSFESFMEIMISIPDELLNGESNQVSRKVLEQFALEGYKTGKLSSKQIGKLLGFSSRFEIDDFLHRHQAFDYTIEDLQADLNTLEDLGLK